MANELYERLGADPNAPAEQLRKAYFRALRAHTAEDDPTGHQAVREAWEILGDEERRRRYDAGQRGGGEAEQLLIQGRAALAEENPQRAVELLRRVLAIAPGMEDASHLLVRALGDAERYDEAIETAKRARSKFGTHLSMLVLAEAHFRKVRALTKGVWANVTRVHFADLDAATKAFLDAAAAAPADSAGLVGAAQVAQYRKNHAEARRLAERAIASDGKVDFDDVAALSIIVLSHIAEKEVQSAAATLDRIAAIAPDSEEVREAVARDLIDYAIMMFKNGAYREAKLLLEPCARLAPNLDEVKEVRKLLERPLLCLDALDRLKSDQLCPGPVITLGIWGYFVFFEEPEPSESKASLKRVVEQLAALPSRPLAEGLYRLRDSYPILWELQDRIFDDLLSAACKDARIPLRQRVASTSTGSRPVVPTPAAKPAPPKPSPAPASQSPPPKPSPAPAPSSRPTPATGPTSASRSTTSSSAGTRGSTAVPSTRPIVSGQNRAAVGTGASGSALSDAERARIDSEVAAARSRARDADRARQEAEVDAARSRRRIGGVLAAVGVLILLGLIFGDGCPSAPAPAPEAAWDEGSVAPAAADAAPSCGNGVVEPGEECDDGNILLEPCGYGQLGCQVCNETCRAVGGAVRRCGDGLVAARLPGEGSGSGWEGCDDGNQEWLDGCDAACQPSELRCVGWGETESHKIEAGTTSFVALSTGASHVCGVTSAGSLACWNRAGKESPYESVTLPELTVALPGSDAAATRYFMNSRLQSSGRYSCVVTGEESATCVWLQPKRLRDKLGPQVFEVAMRQATRLTLTDGGLCASTAEGMKCWRFVFKGRETTVAEAAMPPGVWQDAAILAGSDGVSNLGWLCVLGYSDGRTYCREIPREPTDAPEGSAIGPIVRSVALQALPRTKALWVTSAGVCGVGEERIACADGMNAESGELTVREQRLDRLEARGSEAPARLETSVILPTAKGLCAVVAYTWQGERAQYQWRCAGSGVPLDVQGLVDTSASQTCWWSGAGSPTGILTALYSPPPMDGEWGQDAPPASWFEGSGDAEQLLEWARRRAREGDDPDQARRVMDWAREQSRGQ